MELVYWVVSATVHQRNANGSSSGSEYRVVGWTEGIKNEKPHDVLERFIVESDAIIVPPPTPDEKAYLEIPRITGAITTLYLNCLGANSTPQELEAADRSNRLHTIYLSDFIAAQKT